ncbi:MAG: lysine 2,3-aminomutase [Planctomycetes bacterium]|nr:lysine 2,3-aminomutase [Planctomycetota bacterium]
MPKKIVVAPRPFRVFTRRDLDRIPQLQRFGNDELLAMKAVANVLPFRVNEYVCDELIDWERVPDDPIFQLTFPQPGMLPPGELDRMIDLLRRDAGDAEIQREARRIQQGLNPHPAGQVELNVPRLDGVPLPGMQHKYRETVLFFPSSGQTCHTYCTYCFRWPQFVGLDELKFAAREADSLVAYLRAHPEVNSVLFTGGDPMVMKTRVLRRYIEPLLAPELDHIVSIRIGTKAPAYWPQRFTTDDDADDLMRLFEEVHAAGRHVAIMAHYSHPRELAPPVAQAAIERVQNAGATVRCQAPLIRRVNDDAQTWADLWKRQIVLGAVPYYMFVERDTGPRQYFEVPLARALDIFTTAYRRVSGLGRTVRGPSMSATPGKVLVDGIAEVHGEKVFVLKFLQARDQTWVNRVFFARYDEQATWLDQLRPAFGEKEWWFQPTIRAMRRQGWQPPWGDRSRVRKRVTNFGHVEWE